MTQNGRRLFTQRDGYLYQPIDAPSTPFIG